MTAPACLALNASYEPITLLPLKRALRLIAAGKASLVEGDEARRIRSASLDMAAPVIIKLSRWVRVPRNMRRHPTLTFLRARERGCCAYCGRHERNLRRREFMNRDHVMPLSRGGQNTWENLVLACSTCNSKKADRTPKEAGMPLLVTPRVPQWVHLTWTVRKLTPLQAQFVAKYFDIDEETLRLMSRSSDTRRAAA